MRCFAGDGGIGFSNNARHITSNGEILAAFLDLTKIHLEDIYFRRKIEATDD